MLAIIIREIANRCKKLCGICCIVNLLRIFPIIFMANGRLA